MEINYFYRVEKCEKQIMKQLFIFVLSHYVMLEVKFKFEF